MLRNHLKIAWRNLFKNKLFSVINISGLAAGMSVVLLIGMWIADEFSFDRSFRNHRQLAVIMSTQTWNGVTATDESAAVPLAAALRQKYPTDFRKVTLVSESGNHVLAVANQKISGSGLWAQPEFADMFTLHMQAGSYWGFSNPASLLLAKSMAVALFGSSDPINNTILIDNNFTLKVTGVYEDFPRNSRFYNITFLLPWNNGANADNQETGWSNHHFQVFAELNEHSTIERVNIKIKNITRPYLQTKSVEEILLQPLDRAYLYNEFVNGKCVGGRIHSVIIFGITGLIVLSLACINFMNISTASSERRAIEISIRKVSGSSRYQLITQFLFESQLIVCIAILLTLALVQLSLPFFNAIAGNQIAIPFGKPLFWLLLTVFVLVTGLLSGSYPAFYLSGFNPVKIIKGTFRAGRNASVSRKILTIFQMSVTIGLVAATIILYQQMQFTKKRSVGYNQAGLITFPITTSVFSGHYDAFRNDLLQTGAILNMTESSSPATNVRNSMISFDWEGRDPQIAPLIGLIAVSHDFGKTMGWTIKEGRDFNREFPADSGSFILNEAAVNLTGLKHPVGKTIKLRDQEHLITGVIKNMVMESPFADVQPTIFWLNYDWRIRHVTLSINLRLPLNNVLNEIATVFKKYDPATPFEWRFIDDDYALKFYEGERTGQLAGLFSVLAIFISGLGLYGLASFVMEQRTKEIVIRKVLGATVFNLWKLLSIQFVVLVLISCLIAIPIAYYCMHHWLQTFQYRYEMSFWTFTATASGALLFSLFTVSFHVLKTATSNPVKSLRT